MRVATTKSLDITEHILVENYIQQKVKTYFKFCISLLLLFFFKGNISSIFFFFFNQAEFNLAKKQNPKTNPINSSFKVTSFSFF